jgi:two-component sensor histidine kinase
MSHAANIAPPCLEDILITRELARRPAPDGDSRREALAFQDLARQMVEHPEGLLPHLVQSAMTLCGAQSAGIAIYEPQPAAPGICRWWYVAGRYAPLAGTAMPRDDSPCGVCLDRNAPVLLSYPERVFACVAESGLPHCEMLLAPLAVSGVVAFGALCVVAHDRGGQFSAGDARLLGDLAAFAGFALRMISDAAAPPAAGPRASQESDAPPTLEEPAPPAPDGHEWQAVHTPRPIAAPAIAECPPEPEAIPTAATHPVEETAEERELLVEELNHRVKNLFTVASSLVAITAREVGSARDMATTLTGRFRALSRAHELIRPTHDGEEAAVATFDELVETVIEPYRERDKTDGRILLEGPALPIAGDAVTGFALVLYELATNAAKYGALSPPIGQLLVRWYVDGDDLVLQWMESGVLNLTGPPTEEGFGSRLVRLTVERQLNGTIAQAWGLDGLAVRLRVPLASLSGETNGSDG